jgi:hypothetical protein
VRFFIDVQGWPLGVDMLGCSLRQVNKWDRG